MDPSRIRALQIGRWRLKYRLAAVLSIPLVVAVALGVVRVATQLDEAQRSAALSEQTVVAPALLDFSTALISVATATSLGFTPKNATSDDVTQSMAALRELAAGTDLNSEVAVELDALLTDGDQLYAAVMNSSLEAEELGRRTTDFLARCKNLFRDLFDLFENHDALVDATNLLLMWDAQLNLLDQMESFRLLSTNPEAARLLATNAMNTEESTLRLLRGSGLDTGQIDGMLGDIEARRRLIENFTPSRQFGEDLRNAMISASQPYAEGIDSASARIIGTLEELADETRTAATRDALLVTAALVLALLLAIAVIRSLSVPLGRLRDNTLAAANTELPAAIAAVKDGADIETVRLAPVGTDTDEEIGELSRAVDSMNAQALRLAGEQAHLRKQVNVMLETLARRNKTLVEQQLSLIESLEYEEKDPARLQSMFALDHLATRMRRTGESLLVLAGTRPRTRSGPAPLADVLRGAVSQVENYQRVQIGNTPHGYLVGKAVNDVVHLVAELVDNALRASPPTSPVRFEFSSAVEGGLLLDIADRGIGIPRDAMEEINIRLAAGENADVDAPRQLGLFVIGRLAARNGMSVRLRPTFDTETNAGVTASVYFPAALLSEVHTVQPTMMTERPRRLRTEELPSFVPSTTPTGGIAHGKHRG